MTLRHQRKPAAALSRRGGATKGKKTMGSRVKKYRMKAIPSAIDAGDAPVPPAPVGAPSIEEAQTAGGTDSFGVEFVSA